MASALSWLFVAPLKGNLRMDLFVICMKRIEWIFGSLLIEIVDDLDADHAVERISDLTLNEKG